MTDPRWRRSKNTVINKLYDAIYHVIHFEFTHFCVCYWLIDFYCRSLNPVEATEGGRNQVPGPRGPKVSVVQCSLARIFWDFLYVYFWRSSRAQSASGAPWVTKWSNLPIRENLLITWPYTDRPTACPSDRPSAPRAYQCKITQSTGMATQVQLEVILAGNRIATGVL